MKLFLMTTLFAFSLKAYAKPKTFEISGANVDIATVLKKYSDHTGESFILDSNVRGKITLMFPGKVTKEKAFNAIARGLALNGLTFIENDEGYFTIRQARAAQRANLPVTTYLPAENPVRMVSWVYGCKNVKCKDIFGNIRMLNSKDGESHVDPVSNKLIITDFSDHLHKVAKILKQVDED